MKWFFALLGIAAAGGMGYVAEPTLRPHLTGATAEPLEETEKAPAPPAADETPVVPPAAEPEPAPAPEPEPTPPPVDEEPEPEPAAEEEEEAPADEIPDTDVTEPVMEEEEEEVEAPAPPAAPAAPADVVSVMQASVRDGQIKEFTFDQVLDWKAAEDETVDGATYQTGVISYKAETIFGVKNIEAKALIRNGKVERWIWPKSGMEIK